MAYLGPRFYNNIFGDSSDYRITLPWLHGKITREETEKLLEPKTDGLFLVRESTCFPGDFTLCVCYQDVIRNYRIKWYETILTLDDEEFFDSLEDLVNYYQLHPRGLCTKLTKYIFKESPVLFISDNDIEICQTISKGEFGEVFLGNWNGENVIMKPLLNYEEMTTILKRSVRHENLVYLIGLAKKQNDFYLVSTYMTCKSLPTYLISQGQELLHRKELTKLAYDVSLGMEFLEKMCIVHKDLAARNVIVNEYGIAKITNFCMIDNIRPEYKDLPFRWTAPEIFTTKIYTHMSDVWSYGVLLWEIFSYGRIPYPKVMLQDIKKFIHRGYRMQEPENCPNDMYKLMLLTWNIDPNQRPNFHYIQRVIFRIKQKAFCVQDTIDPFFDADIAHLIFRSDINVNCSTFKKTRHYSI